jgi:hypothetical protein
VDIAFHREISRLMSERQVRLGGLATLNLQGISAADVPPCGIAG